MKNEEIVRALRCISTAGGENACEHCSYWKEEEVPEEERPIYGADTMHSCDVDRVGLDGADLIERLTDRCARYAEEIAVAQERQRWTRSSRSALLFSRTRHGFFPPSQWRTTGVDAT